VIEIARVEPPSAKKYQSPTSLYMNFLLTV